MTEYSPAKTGEYPRIFHNFRNCVRCDKDLKNNKHNSLHLGRKYVRIFVLGHYLFLEANSFPRATLSGNCSLYGTDNVRGQISEHIFAPNGDYCLYISNYVPPREYDQDYDLLVPTISRLSEKSGFQLSVESNQAILWFWFWVLRFEIGFSSLICK